jgi:membrane protease YdiL (CAAX protease family)
MIGCVITGDASSDGWRRSAVVPVALFAALWCVAVVEISGRRGVGQDAGVLLISLAGIALTWRVTRPAPPILVPGGRLRAQLAFLGLFTVWQGGYVLHFHDLLRSPIFLPTDVLTDWVEWIVPTRSWVMNPLVDVVVPGLVICLLGANRRELGVTRGRYTLRVTALWSAIPVVYLAGVIALGAISASAVGSELLSNTFQNGPVEEFYWRGIVQTRLERSGQIRALIVTSLLFGFWHVGMQLVASSGELSLALARCVTQQAIGGLVFGALFQRTRSLIAPSIFHVLSNTVLQVFNVGLHG